MQNGKIPVLVVFVGCLGGPVIAEDVHCSLIDDHAERTGCYASAPNTASPSTSSKWLVTKSNYFKSVVVTRTANWKVMCEDREGTVTILMVCKDKQTRVDISTGCKMGETGDHKDISVRIDEEIPVKQAFVIPNNRNVLDQNDEAVAIPFIKSMLGRESMNVRITPPSEASFTATFTLAGLDEKIEPVRKACNW